ncbi:MAG: hypothetical protein K0V04_21975 [Deltaproteobacteria bacterium]|nr:hypothetical protein [Deltaproteobacteria bacterium]
MWFETLTGFEESAVADVAEQFVVEGERMTSRANGRTMIQGRFETPSLGELRPWSTGTGPALRVSEVVADVQMLHRDPSNAGALFQVASQFNTLEMVGPSVTPEQGIDRYETDRTQGPACAVACGAGTVYRNYLVPFADGVGQTARRQIDCLADLGVTLGNEGQRLWQMRNGYALPTEFGIHALRDRLADADEATRDRLMADIRIGMQWDTEVTLGNAGHQVTQAYCSAVPVAYSRYEAPQWEPFARLVLDAAYEATLGVALTNARATGNPRVYLTLLGGGAFGNPHEWIVAAIERALGLFAGAELEVAIVSYGRPNPRLRPLVGA